MIEMSERTCKYCGKPMKDRTGYICGKCMKVKPYVKQFIKITEPLREASRERKVRLSKND